MCLISAAAASSQRVIFARSKWKLGLVNEDLRVQNRSQRRHERCVAPRVRPVVLRVAQKIGKAASAFVASSVLLCGSVDAVSTENLLFLEAWRGVNRAYVDKGFNHQNWLQLRENYLRKESMANREETYASIERMLSTLSDPFTRFLDPSKYSALKGGTRGVVTGVGLEVAYAAGKDGKPELVVVAPAPNSPADREGVSPGDVLLEIDGVSTEDDSLYTIGDKLQGDRGTEVSLTLRTKQGKIETVTMKREEVVFNPVNYKYCTGIPSIRDSENGNLGYIQILRFTSQTATDVERAIRSLKAKGIDRFLLDLRNNGGGSFPAGIAVSRMFLDQGDVVLIADTEGVRDIVSAEGTSLDSTTPLTVLVNRGTASASEVLSGAIQDNRRGIIVGEPTFGKGLIQTLIPLSDGSAITVTTAKYQTPLGQDINGIGIQPDVLLPSDSKLPFGDERRFCDLLKQSESEVTLFKQ